MAKKKSVKHLRLAKEKEEWQLEYDEKAQTLTIGGPSPLGREIHEYLTSEKRVIDPKTGQLMAVDPLQSWDYLIQVIEIDLYKDLGVSATEDQAD